MTKETSPLEKELEKILTRHMVQPPKSGARIALPEKTDVSMHAPLRVQQPIMQRQQYYTGDA